MRKTSIMTIVLLSLVLALSAGCPSFEANNPEPIADFETFVGKTVYHWLQVRVDEITYPILSSSSAAWRSASTVQELVDWFSVHLTPSVLWNFQRLVDDIKYSEWYDDPSSAPSSAKLLDLLKDSLSSFRYGSEQ